MNICSTCGTQFEETASFCPNCGTGASPRYHGSTRKSPKEPVSVGGWIGRSLIPCIPLVGGLVYLIMLCIWSGDTKKEETFRNWAKAQLIIMAVVVVLSIILAVAFGSVFAELASYM